MSARYASLLECDERLSIEDVYLLLEMMAIDAHNQRVLNPKD